MTAAEWEELRGFRQDVRALRGDLQALRLSVASCQAASAARVELAARRPSWLSAFSSVGALLVAGAALVLNFFRR